MCVMRQTKAEEIVKRNVKMKIQVGGAGKPFSRVRCGLDQALTVPMGLHGLTETPRTTPHAFINNHVTLNGLHYVRND